MDSLHFGAAVFADQDAVANLDLEGRDFAVVALLAGAEGDDLRLLRLLFGAVRNDDSAANLLFFLDMLDEHTIPDGLDFNVSHFVFGFGLKDGVTVFCGEHSAPAANTLTPHSPS